MSDDPHSSPRPTAAESDAAETAARGAWATRAGFIFAAVGSAVGLGNMWRFPYLTAEEGGAAFVLLYLLMTFLIGIPLMICEFAVGRRTRRSPIAALRREGGNGWTPLGYLFVATGFLILAYYSVIAGWVTRYALGALLSGFPADPGAHFSDMASGGPAILFHLAFMVITIGIVMGGVEKGIERASLLMMPTLFLLILGLAVWAFTLAGSEEGYAFYLAPDIESILSFSVLGEAASQAFFSLSLGMGAMLTFASYLSRDNALPNEATIIAFSDFGVAFVAGLVVFPIIFALGLQEQVGESTIGALFISLPAAFASLGVLGRVIGAGFFIALFIGATTSAISLLEVVTSSVIDEWKIPRKQAALWMGVAITLLGIWPALDLDALGAFDAVASSVFLPLGGLFLAIFVGWVMHQPVDEVAEAASPGLRRIIPAWYWTIRVVAPVLLVVVLIYTVPTAIDAVRALGR
ncbi:MAG: sodium-dependent transporter [Longimicrobiales bacterium]